MRLPWLRKQSFPRRYALLKSPAWTANLPPDTPWFEAELMMSAPGLTPQEFVGLVNGILTEIEHRTRPERTPRPTGTPPRAAATSSPSTPSAARTCWPLEPDYARRHLVDLYARSDQHNSALT